MDSLNKLFQTSHSEFSRKALDYLDDLQMDWVTSMLNDPYAGRNNWKEKGLKPVYRNITKNIIEKSSLLYKDGLPQMEVLSGETIDETASLKFNDLLEQEGFNEFAINFDQVVRLLKTALILTQHDPYDNTVKLSILHQGNASVSIDFLSKKITTLVIRTGQDEEYYYFRVMTDGFITDYREKINRGMGSEPEMVNQEENPYGFVPVTEFYDTHLPRTKFWVTTPHDLINFNNSLNMYLIDSEYSVSYSNHQTLFTNMVITDETGEPAIDTVVGGIGKVVMVDSTGIDAPYLEYKGPTVDLTAGQELFIQRTKDIAADWGVTIKADGLSTQSVSGFSLIVQEKDNLELRQQRARMQEAGLERFYDTFIRVYNTHNVGSFNENTKLKVTFSTPKLPFDEAKNEAMWSERIQSGKASVIMYLMDKYSITREEAQELHKEIKSDNFNGDIIDDNDDLT